MTFYTNLVGRRKREMHQSFQMRLSLRIQYLILQKVYWLKDRIKSSFRWKNNYLTLKSKNRDLFELSLNS